ncbi:MAG: PRC-barrel domain-containing protein [bacterium]
MNLRQISTVHDMPVLDLETGEVLGRVVSWAVNSKEQRVAAFLLNKTSFFRTWPVVVPADIVEYGPHMVVARDRNSIIAPREVVGLPELIAAKNTLIDFRAETESGETLGTVKDFLFDTIGSRIQKYYIGPVLPLGQPHHELVVPASQVISIEGGKIIFADSVGRGSAQATHKPSLESLD